MRKWIDTVRRELAYYRALLAHPRTPRVSKWLLAAAIAYFLSPIDLIPDAIPVLGQLDDLLIVPGLICLAVSLIPAAVRSECRSRLPGLLLLLCTLAAGPAAAEGPWQDLEPTRIAALAKLLPAGAEGLGRPIDDRAAWAPLATNPALLRVASSAGKLLGKPLPPWDEERYLDFSRTGARLPGEQMLRARGGRLDQLVWAEGLEHRDRFTAEINRLLDEAVKEPTWTLPAHDRSLGSLRGTAYEIDLVASARAFELAQVLWLMGDRIEPAVRARVLAALEARVFAPFRDTLRTGKRHWWLRGSNNWNPVCLAGTVGAALATMPDRFDRALFVAAAETYSRNYLSGFTADGYCSEGIGYWNYGMINYVTLREHVWQATRGQLDLFADPRVRAAALFGLRTEILDGVFPAIADCRPGATPSAQILRYCSLALGLGLRRQEAAWDPMLARDLVTSPIELFPSSLTRARPAAQAADTVGLRTWFNEAGLLICRPAPGDPFRFAAALKGGHNDEHHNHNDLGSFTVVLGGQILVGDPGGPNFYNARTFSNVRYTAFKLFSSLGHPVPLVAGQAQRPGREAAARILPEAATATPAGDTFAIDLRSAYPVPELKSLVRTFRYSRGSQPALRVQDELHAEKPVSFETALTTRAKWKRASEYQLEFAAGGQRLLADIEPPPGGVDISAEKIEEDCVPFERIAVRLRQPLAAGRLAITFRPAPSP